MSAYPSTMPKKPAPPPSAEDEAAAKNGADDDDDDIAFAIDEDDIMIIEPANETSASASEAQVQQQEALAGQTVSEEQGRITGKKRSANEAGLAESPAKKERRVDEDAEKQGNGEKAVEVVDLT